MTVNPEVHAIFPHRPDDLCFVPQTVSKRGDPKVVLAGVKVKHWTKYVATTEFLRFIIGPGQSDCGHCLMGLHHISTRPSFSVSVLSIISITTTGSDLCPELPTRRIVICGLSEGWRKNAHSNGVNVVKPRPCCVSLFHLEITAVLEARTTTRVERRALGAQNGRTG